MNFSSFAKLGEAMARLVNAMKAARTLKWFLMACPQFSYPASCKRHRLGEKRSTWINSTLGNTDLPENPQGRAVRLVRFLHDSVLPEARGGRREPIQNETDQVPWLQY